MTRFLTKSICWISCLILLINPDHVISQTTITLQPDSLEGKDALIFTLEPNTTFGKSVFYRSAAWTWEGVPGLNRCLLEFNLSLIPDNAKIIDARLSLYFHHIQMSVPMTHSSLGGPNISLLQRIENEWDENSVTWNNQPPVDTTNQVILPESTSPTQDYPNIDVTAIIQDMVKNPLTSHGFLFRLQTEEYYRRMVFASSDHLVDSLHPKLVITFCACNPFLGNDTTICDGTGFKLTPGSFYQNYFWQDGSTDSVFIANTSGLYWVEVTDSVGCVAHDSIFLNLIPSPEINLGNDTVFCQGNSIILSPGAGFQNYLWQDNSTQPSFTVTESGLYWVEVGNEFGCTSRDSIEITITLGPEIFLGNDSTLCVGDTLVLSPGQFEDYLWQDGSSGSTFYAFENGTFWVMVTDEFGCQGYDTLNLNFVLFPDVLLGNDTLICGGLPIILDAGAGYENYLWQDGSADQTLFINQTGTFWVQVSNLCGSSSDTINVNFSEPFDISLGSDTSFCYGQNIILDAGAGFSEYLWQNGANSQTSIANFTGNYWVEVTDSLGCTATDTIFIETFMDFDISIGEDVVKICKGDYIFLNGPGGYQNYLWQDGSDFTSLLADTAGIYWLEVTDENGCSARDSMQLVVNQIPSKILENDTTICPETELTLNALPGYSSYLWQDGSAGQDFVTTQPGKFWVTVQDEIGCSGTDSILVKPFQTPDLGVEDQEIICPGDTLVLNAGDENFSYLWQDGSDNPDFYVTEEGNYWVQIETICGFYTDSVEVQIYKGNLDLGRDTTLCDGEILKLDPGNNYSNHFWSNGSTESSILIGEEGNYWLKAFDGFCSISDTIYVEVCASIWVPNVFTPNSDGINDTFYAIATNPDGITAFKMTIFNRWGRIVHEMGNFNEFWDGKINGSVASPGAYFWVCDFAARDKTGNIKNHSRQGSVTLVR